jgi:hypothetical protein
VLCQQTLFDERVMGDGTCVVPHVRPPPPVSGALAFTRPVFPSPVPLDGTRTLGLLLRAPHPTVTSDARQSGDRSQTLTRDSPLRHQPTSSR